jgi:hypothetical protein
MSSVALALEGHIVIMLVSFGVNLLLYLVKLHAVEMYGGIEV